LRQLALAVRFDPDGMLARAIEVDVAGRPIPSLAPGSRLVDRGARTRAPVDVPENTCPRWTRSRTSISIGMRSARARAARMERMLFVGMLLARELFGTAWPRDLAAGARRDSHAARLARELAVKMFSPLPPRKINPQQWSLFLRCRETRADQLRYCTRAVLAEWILKLP
jgi:hypothetical protein